MSAINDALRRASSAAKSSSQPPGSPLAPMNVPAAKPPWADPPPVASSASAPAAVTPPPIIAPPLNSLAMPPLRNEPTKKSSKLPLILVLAFLLCVGGVGALYFFGKGRLIASAREKLQGQEEELTDNDRLAALFGDAKAVGQIANAPARSNQPAAMVTTTTVTQSQAAVVPVTTQSATKPNPPVPSPAPIVAAKPAPAAPRTPVHFPPLRLQSIFYRPGNASVMINGKTLFVGDEINGVSVADIQAANVTLVLSGQTNVLTLR